MMYRPQLPSFVRLNSSKSNKRTNDSINNFSSSSSIKLRQLSFWVVTFLLVPSCFGYRNYYPETPIVYGNSFGEGRFKGIGCEGSYNLSSFARLDRICEDCYNIYRHPTVSTKCSSECFSTAWFEGCVRDIQECEQLADLKPTIKELYGQEPRFLSSEIAIERCSEDQ